MKSKPWTKEKQFKVNMLIMRAVRAQNKIDKIKAEYEKLDEVMDELKKLKVRGAAHGRYMVEVVDNFSKNNVAYRTTSVRRYQLKVDKL